MQELCNTLDKQSKLIKIIFALPVLDIIWAIYRICKSVIKNNAIGIILGILMIFIGASIWWIVDIICIILTDHVLWID